MEGRFTVVELSFVTLKSESVTASSGIFADEFDLVTDFVDVVLVLVLSVRSNAVFLLLPSPLEAADGAVFFPELLACEFRGFGAKGLPDNKKMYLQQHKSNKKNVAHPDSAVVVQA